MIKDHKKADSNGLLYPTRLVVPATNFTAGFPKLGYLGIKRIFDASDMVKYGSKTIVQASDLKEKLQTMGLTSENVTIVSIDAVAMYPSIKYKLIEKAIEWYALPLPVEDRETIKSCLELIKFGMESTLVTFEDKYYLYDGDQLAEEKGLMIGGYESAWLADLAMSFLLDTLDEKLFEPLTYYGFYRDDGIFVFAGKWDDKMISNWLESFQGAIDVTADGDYLQFTADINNKNSITTSSDNPKVGLCWNHLSFCNPSGMCHI